MAQDMVIIAPPKQRMTGMLREFFRNDTEAINIRDDAGPGYNGTLAFSERRRLVGHGPTHEEMSNGTHFRASYYSYSDKTIR